MDEADPVAELWETLLAFKGVECVGDCQVACGPREIILAGDGVVADELGVGCCDLDSLTTWRHAGLGAYVIVRRYGRGE